jgi:hypothetical protein
VLVIKVELHPHGDSSKAKELGRLTIENITHSNNDTDDYMVEVNGRQIGHIKGFSHALGTWRLVQRALEIMLGKVAP